MKKRSKCDCLEIIDAGVLADPDSAPFGSFDKKPNLCISIRERENESDNSTDREIKEENASLARERSIQVEVLPREREGYDEEIGTEINQESLWTRSIAVVKHDSN